MEFEELLELAVKREIKLLLIFPTVILLTFEEGFKLETGSLG